MHQTRHYRADIDGLRALAVSGVLLFHAFPETFPLGYLGVDVFFVLSGYLISGVMARALIEGRFSLITFYANRVRRIFPSLILIMGASLGFGWFYLLDNELALLGKHVLGGGAFVANVVLMRESGYFDEEAIRKPLLHLWSLGVEEQFYIVFPLLFGGLYGATRRLRLSAGLTFIVALGMAGWSASASEAVRFYSPLSRAWELGAGVALSMLGWHRPAQRPLSQAQRHCWSIVWWIGLSLLLISLVQKPSGGFLHQHPAVLSVLSTCLLVAAGARLPSVPLSAAPLVGLGLISYAVYLWHWPLFAFSHIITGEHLGMSGRLALLLISLLLGWATTRWIETPLRYGAQRWKVPALLGSMLAIMLTGAWLMWHPSALPRPIDSGQVAQFDYGQHWQGWENCDAIRSNPMLGGCKRLNAHLPEQIAILGDSHAGHLATGLRRQLQDKGVGISILLHAGCLPVLEREAPHGHDFECPDRAIEQGLKHIEQQSSIRVVALAGYHIAYVTGHRLHQREELSAQEQRRRLTAWQEGMADMIERLQAAGKQVVVLRDTPELRKDPQACVRRGWPFDSRCGIDMPFTEVNARARPVDEATARLGKRFTDLMFVDLRAGLCDTDVCHATRHDELWYASRDHLTPAGSTRVGTTLAPALIGALRQAR